MSSQNPLKLTPDDAREVPMVDLAFSVLKSVNNPMYYRDLMHEIAKIKGLSDKEVMQVIAQVYTEINIDGRFACVGNNLWGLKRWYPVERTEDAMGGGKHPRIINDDDDDDLDDDTLFADEAEEFAADDDGFDTINEDADELFDSEAEEIDDEVEEELDEEIDSEELDDEDLSDDLEESDDEDEDDEAEELEDDEEDALEDDDK